MKTRIRRAAPLASASAFAIFMSCITACAQTGKPLTDRELRGRGTIVDSRLAKGATQKEGLSGISDAGNEIFSHLRLNPNVFANSTFGGGTNMSFPRWVHVTWRQGPGVDFDWKRGGFVGGTIIGDHKVEILSRIPEEIFKYVGAGPGRAIVLRFLIKDDGVLFAWDVQETVLHPSGGRGLVYSMHGGDFPCENNPNRPHPNCTEGRLENAPWYDPLWTRQ